MTDVARLGLVIDSSGAKAGRDEFVRSANDIKKAAGEVVGAVNPIEGAYKRAASGIRTFMAAAGLAVGVKQLIAYADQWKSLTGQLKLVTKGHENLLSTEAKLFHMAQNTRQEYGAVVSLYGRMARSASELGIAEEKLLRVTETISKSLIVSGTSAAAASGGLMQLGQALAAGQLRGDEFNSVIEQMPRLAEAIAAGMQKPRSELRELAKDGKITSEAIINALLTQGEVIDREFSQMPVRVSEAWTVMRNEIMKYIGEADKGTGVTAALSDAILFAARNIGILANAAGVFGVVAVAKWIGPMGAALQKNIATQLHAMAVSRAHGAALVEDAMRAKVAAISQIQLATTVEAKAAAEARAIVAARAHAAAMAATTISARAAAGAMGLLRGAMAFLGGPWGVAITAIATAVFYLYNRLKGTREEAHKYKEAIKAATLAQAEMSNELKNNVTQLDAQLAALKRGGLTAYENVNRQHKILNNASDAWDKYRKEHTKATGAELDFQAAIKAGNVVAVELWNNTKRQVNGEEELRQMLDKATSARNKATQAVEKANDVLAEQDAREIRDLKDMASVLKLGSDRDVAFMQQQIELRNQIADATKGLSKTQAAAVESALREADAQRQANRQLEERRKLLASVRYGQETIAGPKPIQDKPKSAEQKRREAEELAIAAKIQAELETAKQVAENFLRSIQGSFGDFFNRLFTDGLSGWEDFFRRIYGMFTKLIADMIAAALTSRLKNAFAGMLDGVFSGKGAGIPGASKAGNVGAALGAGAFVGSAIYGVGTMAPTRNQAKYGGAALGFGAGSVGGPGLGIVGALAGAATALFGFDKKAKETAKAMAEAQKQFAVVMDAYIATARGTNNSVADALRQSELQRQELIKQANAAYGGKKNEAKREGFMDDINKAAVENAQRIKDEYLKSIDEQINALSGKGVINDLNAITKQYEENVKSLVAAGGDVAKADELRRLQLEKLFTSMSDSEFEQALTHMPIEFQAMAKAMREAAKNGENLNRVLTEQGRAILDEIPIREARLKGNEKEAMTLEAAINKQRALQAAMENGLNAEQIKRLAELLDGELAAALANLELQAQLALKAFDDDMNVRLLQATGRSGAAEELRLAIAHENELAEARRNGLDDARLATLELVQALEKQAAAQEKARRAAEMAADIQVRYLQATGQTSEAEKLRKQIQDDEELRRAREAGVDEETIKKLLEVQRLEMERLLGLGQVSPTETQESSGTQSLGVQFTEVTAGRLVDVNYRMAGYLERIANAVERNVATTGAGGGDINITTNVSGTFSGTPQENATTITDRQAESVDRRIGMRVNDRRLMTGNPELHR